MTAGLRNRDCSTGAVPLAFALALVLWPAAGTAAGTAAARDGAALESEQAAIAKWRSERVESLTSDNGWLTLTGLFWLKEGENTFGRAPGNTLVLDNAALAGTAGSFVLTGNEVRVRA